MTNEGDQDVDAALGQQARDGNAAAFVKLATRWWTPVYRLVWNLSGSTCLAADVTERTLLRAIRSLEPPSPASVPFKVFLYRLAVGLTLAADAPAWREKPLDTACTVRQAIQRLDPVERAPLVLREIEQLPLEEAAAILRTSSEEVRKRAHRALLFLARSAGPGIDPDAPPLTG